jgi:hypothetical protein
MSYTIHSRFSCTGLSPEDEGIIRSKCQSIQVYLAVFSSITPFHLHFDLQTRIIPDSQGTDKCSQNSYETESQTASEQIQRLTLENTELVRTLHRLRKFIAPTERLMESNPELFGGEVRGPEPTRPSRTIRMREPLSEFTRQRLMNTLEEMGSCEYPVDESISTVSEHTLNFIQEQTSSENLVLTRTSAQREITDTRSESTEPLNDTAKVSLPKVSLPKVSLPKVSRPNFNHLFWPSPRTKRFAKHISERMSFRSYYEAPMIKTHQDALNYLARQAKISVEELLKINQHDYQVAHFPWSLPDKGTGNDVFYSPTH